MEDDATAPATRSLATGAITLYWIPLGAGGHSVRHNGRVYEAVCARLQRRPRYDLYHAALEVTVHGCRYVIEMSPIPDRRGVQRGVVVEGPVGSVWLRRLRIFRYEIRCWANGSIPDAVYASHGPVAVATGAAQAHRLLALVPLVPPLVWGRDELDLGEMWNSNSVTSWLLTRAGVPAEDVAMPTGGRAPGWQAGARLARRTASTEPTPDHVDEPLS